MVSKVSKRGLSNRRLKVIGLSISLLGAAALLYSFSPAESGLYPPSPFRVLTGLYCPGCGTLRGLHHLLHGRLLAALDLNPLMVISIPWLLYAYLAYCLPVVTGRRIYQLFIPSAWIWGFLKVVLGYWVLRNIPVFPFSWLAP
jgi:hypothetical protein